MAEILVIDDDEITRSFLRAALELDGHRIRLAADGSDGLLEFRLRQADLVICDLIMPGRDGVETIAELRQLSPATPVIAITGGGEHSSQQQLLTVARHAGVSRTLAKPFAPDVLLAAVRAALGSLGE